MKKKSSNQKFDPSKKKRKPRRSISQYSKRIEMFLFLIDKMNQSMNLKVIQSILMTKEHKKVFILWG